jgi:hypothetical protein
MQALHDVELLIDASQPPAVFHLIVKKGFLSWEAKGFDGLELPNLSSFSGLSGCGNGVFEETCQC